MISEFFKNSEIFVTGGSGVVGKALIEKLLLSCNVKKLYILLRPKRNLSIEERLEKMKREMIFHQLQLQKPGEMDKKLIVIPGDATEPLLGITPKYQKILQNVSIIFHCAATVRFDEPLRYAIKLNVGGTLEALKFAETLVHLKAFMHISTFFSNPYLKYVEKKLYESPMDWKFCLNLIENKEISEEQMDAITRKLIVGFPNTYCFTKNLAESLVNDYRDKLPVGIYRPSIFLFSIEEPEPGFSTTLMGAMGLFALTGAGILKAIYLGKDVKLDFTPPDYGIRVLCYYTLKTAHLYENKKRPAEIPVFMFSSSNNCKLTFRQYISYVQDYNFWNEAAFEKNVLIPYLYCTDNRFVYMFLVFFKQFLVSLLADSMLVVLGKKPALMQVQRKLFHTLEVMKPFLLNNYESDGITDINEILELTRGMEFNIDFIPAAKDTFRNIGICRFMVYNIRKHLMKEDPKTLPKARRILQIKIWIYKIIQILLALKIYNKIMDYTVYIYHEKLSVGSNSTFCCDVD